MTLTYTRGQWGSSPASLSHITNLAELYDYLPKIGFDTYRELVHHAGEARLYAQRSGTEMYPFQFLCVLEIGGFYYPLLIKDVQSVLQFTKEIDAHRKDQEDGARAIAELTKTLKDAIQVIKGSSHLASNRTSRLLQKKAL